MPVVQAQNKDVLKTRVKFRVTNRDLSNVLVDLSKKSKINIAFKIIDIPEKTISIYSPNYTLKVILDYLLKDTDLKYDVLNRQIVVFKETKNSKRKRIISGYIIDEITGEKLVYANVYLPDYSKGTISNSYGFYSLELSREENEIVFSYLGYIPKVINIKEVAGDGLDVVLKPRPETILKEVVVVSGKMRNKRLEFFSPENIEIARIKNMVHLFGESDVFRYIHTKPGVLTGVDGLGGMHVRGSNSGSNKILLDGVPVYNAQHAIGLLSIFNSSVIKNTKFIKTAFPARYGGVLGSVMDIKTRDGNNKNYTGEIDIGLISAKASIEGPIFKGKGSVLFSFRRTFVDLWSDGISSLQSTDLKTQDFSYYFYDLNFKANIQVNQRNKLFFNYYSGKDEYFNEIVYFDTPEQIIEESRSVNKWKWGNSLFSFQWNTQPGKKMFINTSIYFSDFSLASHSFDNNLIPNTSKQYLYNGNTLDSGIKDIGLKIDFDYSLNNQNIKWGLSTVNHELSPMVYFKSVPNEGDNYPKEDDVRSELENYQNSSYENRLYFEDEIKFGTKTTFNLGLNFAHFDTGEKNYYSIEPRFIFNQALSNKVIISLSATNMSQFIHTLTNGGLGMPSEVFLPSTKYLKPERMWHYNSGLVFDLDKSLSFSVQAYYNKAKNLIEHKDGSTFIVGKKSSWENYIPEGIGRMYGVESEVKFSRKRLNLILNYTFSKTQRKHENINNGEYYDYRFSRTHFLNLVSIFKVTERMNFYLSFVYGSGSYYTTPTQLTPDLELIYEAKNNYQLPYYQRVDIGMDSKFKVKKVRQELKFGIYNLLNRKNPFYLIYKSSNSELLESNLKEVYVFPILPYIRYKIIF